MPPDPYHVYIYQFYTYQYTYQFYSSDDNRLEVSLVELQSLGQNYWVVVCLCVCPISTTTLCGRFIRKPYLAVWYIHQGLS